MSTGAPANASSSRPAGRGGLEYWLSAALVAAGVLVYFNSFSGVFLFDDELNILFNEHLRGPTLDWGWVWTARRPTLSLSLLINWSRGGTNTWGYHALNLVVHLLAGLTLFGIVRRTLLSARLRDAFGQAAPWLAMVISLVWLVHPLQTQCVTYIIQRSESIMGLFYLLTLYCVIRGACSSRPLVWYAAAVVACGLGMGSKAVMLTAPVVVLLYDRVFLSSSWSEVRRRRWGLYVGLASTWGLLFVFGIVRAIFFAGPASSPSVGFGFKGISPLEYALTEPGVILHYLRLCIWPHPLILDYEWPVARTVVAIVPPALVIAALLGWTVWALRHKPALGFLGMWFFLILVPTSSIVPVKDPAFEHRMYLPLAAVVALVIVACWWTLARLFACFSARRGVQRFIVGGPVVAVAVMLGFATVQRNADYHSAVAFWTDAVQKRPASARTRTNLGISLYRTGSLDEAVTAYREAIAIRPDYAEAYYNLGTTLKKQEKLDEAIEAYREALRLKPTHTRANLGLGRTLAQAGRREEAVASFRTVLELKPDYVSVITESADTLVELGRVTEAAQHYRATLKLQPNDLRAHTNLASILMTLGEHEDAFDHFRQALASGPDNGEVHVAAANAMVQVGRLDEAIGHYRRAVELDLENAAWLKALADALLGKGLAEEAVQQYEAALQVDPGAHAVQNNLANALMSLGRFNEAFDYYERALAGQPNYADAHVSFGYALAQTGRLEEAIDHYRRALELDPDNVLCWNNLGNALLNQGHTDEAIATFRQALAIDAERADTYSNLGNALVSAGNLAGAVAHYVKAIELQPELLPAYYNLAETYGRMGRPGDAKRQYSRALELAEQTGQAAAAERIRQRMAALD